MSPHRHSKPEIKVKSCDHFKTEYGKVQFSPPGSDWKTLVIVGGEGVPFFFVLPFPFYWTQAILDPGDVLINRLQELVGFFNFFALGLVFSGRGRPTKVDQPV